jgi:hypothetical protein
VCQACYERCAEPEPCKSGLVGVYDSCCTLRCETPSTPPPPPPCGEVKDEKLCLSQGCQYFGAVSCVLLRVYRYYCAELLLWVFRIRRAHRAKIVDSSSVLSQSRARKALSQRKPAAARNAATLFRRRAIN